MKMNGEQRIPADRQTVWAALNDAGVLKRSIPGCKELDKLSDSEFAATVVAKVGPVKATFKGEVALSEIKPPHSYVISGQGKGGPAGFAKGAAKVRLTEEGEATVLSYQVDAQVGGKLAQIGSRLIDQTAKKMADQFFKKFAKEVSILSGAEPAPAETAEPAEAASEAEAAMRRRREEQKLIPGGYFWWFAAIAAVAWLIYFLINAV